MIENQTCCTSASEVPLDRRALLARYREPDLRAGMTQLLLSVVPFCLLWAAMWYSLRVSYLLTLVLAVPTAGFLVRLYILHHDCGHGSFFKSKRLNDATGYLLGLFVMTPYHVWRRQHALHHASSGDLDRRGFGDVAMMTVGEYLQMTPRQRLGYRLYRNPLVLFGIAPILYFAVLQRFTWGLPASWKKERANIHWTNLILLCCAAGLCWVFGTREFLMVHVPVTVLASSFGVWLFYVQHNFDGTWWERHADWDFGVAAMEGSSYYQLPRPLQWLTANIGFHHIHHLDSRIPSYRLPECYAGHAAFQDVYRLTLWQSFSCVTLKLWDEDQRRMVGYPTLTTGGAAR